MEDFDEKSAKDFLDKVTNVVDASLMDDGFPVSLSIGSVTCHQPPESSSKLLHEVDLKMYERKMALKASRP
jgi:hypothetical protein